MIATQLIDTRIYRQFIIIIKESKYFRKAEIEEVVLMYLLIQAAVRVAFIYQKYYSSVFYSNLKEDTWCCLDKISNKTNVPENDFAVHFY